MVPKLDTWTIVIIGGWNPKIFRPDWVGKELFDRKTIAVEVSLAPGTSIVRFSSPEDGLLLIPSEDRLIVGIRKGDDEVVAKAEGLARKALELLPHTPVGAVGVNFGFVEPNPAPALTSLFSFADLDGLSKTGCEVKRSSITRNLVLQGTTLNVTHTLVEGQVEIHLNFHRDSATATQAVEHLTEKAVAFLQLGTKFLKDVYGCEMENANEE